jgi:hypothetical protein
MLARCYYHCLSQQQTKQTSWTLPLQAVVQADWSDYTPVSSTRSGTAGVSSASFASSEGGHILRNNTLATALAISAQQEQLPEHIEYRETPDGRLVAAV